MTLSNRRAKALTFTLVAILISSLTVDWINRWMGDSSTFTGLVLLIATLSLYLLTLRKRLVAWRFGPVSRWLQWHMYAGTFAAVIFLMHIGWPIRGAFEQCLAAGFVLVSVLGMVLGILSRTTPGRLSAIKQDARLEQIPQLRMAVARTAHQVALASTQLGEGATLADFYQRRLLGYFQSPRGWLYRWIPTGGKRRQLIRELENLDRYLADKGVEHSRKLAAMVLEKDDLDYQQALQSRLRSFYMMHVGLTWSLLIMIGVHVVMVLRYSEVLL